MTCIRMLTWTVLTNCNELWPTIFTYIYIYIYILSNKLLNGNNKHTPCDPAWPSPTFRSGVYLRDQDTTTFAPSLVLAQFPLSYETFSSLFQGAFGPEYKVFFPHRVELLLIAIASSKPSHDRSFKQCNTKNNCAVRKSLHEKQHFYAFSTSVSCHVFPRLQLFIYQSCNVNAFL